jgi:hypothetical protein
VNTISKPHPHLQQSVNFNNRKTIQIKINRAQLIIKLLFHHLESRDSLRKRHAKRLCESGDCIVYESRAVCVIMWEKYCTAGQATDDNMAHAHCMLDAEGTHSEYVILIALTLQQWLHERASMLRYTYIAFIVE